MENSLNFMWGKFWITRCDYKENKSIYIKNSVWWQLKKEQIDGVFLPPYQIRQTRTGCQAPIRVRESWMMLLGTIVKNTECSWNFCKTAK